MSIIRRVLDTLFPRLTASEQKPKKITLEYQVVADYAVTSRYENDAKDVILTIKEGMVYYWQRKSRVMFIIPQTRVTGIWIDD